MHLKFNRPDSAQAVAAWEKELGMAVPAPLKQALTKKGAFSSGSPADMEERTFQIYPAEECRRMGNGLIAHIDALWGGRPEFEDFFSQDELISLNRSYAAFAEVCVNQNAFIHYYFDSAGKFGWLYYDQDDFEAAEQSYFRPLLTRSQAAFNFDEIVSHMISSCLAHGEYDSIGEAIPGERWVQALQRLQAALEEGESAEAPLA